MKIDIFDFGPIKHFEFNPEKSFIGIFGKNNAGKSYSISVVYLMIKHMIDIYNDDLKYLPILIEEQIKNIENDLKKLYPSEKKNYNIKRKLEFILKDILSEIYIDRLYNSFYSAFNELSTLKNPFSKNTPKIILNSDLLEISFAINSHIELTELTLKKNVIIRNIDAHRNFKTETDQFVLYISDENDTIFYKNCLEFTNMALLSLGKEIKNYVDDVCYLPASRSGLYQALSAFSQIFAELSKKRSLFENKFEIPGIPEPISDYFLRLSEINVKSKDILPRNELHQIVSEIEKEILKGEISFDDANKRIYYIPDELNIRLDVSMTSSMVSEISPVVSYLKYIIPQKADKRLFRKEGRTPYRTLLFIEEPEAHLHPRVQIQLMEIFSKLTKINVKIVITSHSNYMFNKLNNLVLSQKLLPENIEVIVFDDAGYGAAANNAQIDQLGIEDNNFLDVAEELYEEKIELIENIAGTK